MKFCTTFVNPGMNLLRNKIVEALPPRTMSPPRSVRAIQCSPSTIIFLKRFIPGLPLSLVWSALSPSLQDALLFQCLTPPLKSIPASSFPHAPCPPSWIPSLPAPRSITLRDVGIQKRSSRIDQLSIVQNGTILRNTNP